MDSQTFLQVTAYVTKRIIYGALKDHVHLNLMFIGPCMIVIVEG